jgi:predicted lipoprotein with Yx(FWY)xxD motif
MGLRRPGVRLAAIATGFALAASAATAATTSLAVVHSAKNSALGIILVGASGRTLYHDSAEPKNVVKCTGGCVSQWPPLLVEAGAKPVAGPGVTPSWLGTVKRPDGKLQVTYRGMALYLFSGDRKAGDVNGQGRGAIWHAIAPSGAIVTKSVKSSTPATGSKSSGSTTGSGSTSGSGSSGSGSTSDANAAYCASNPMGCNNGVPITGA